MTPARGWLSRRTLRGRLIAGLVTLLAVACATIGIVTYAVLHSTLLGQTDTQLLASGGRYASCIEENQKAAEEARESANGGSESPAGGSSQTVPPTPAAGSPGSGASAKPPVPRRQDCSKITGQSPGTLGARVKNGAVTECSVVAGRCRLTPAERRALTRLQAGRFYTMDLTSLNGDYRLTAGPGRDGDLLITGLPLAGMESTLRQVELAEVVVFAAALLLTGVIGAGWVRLSLRPLRRVAATATRVTQLPLASGDVTLSERVPDADPRTEVGQVGAAFNRMLGHVEAALARRAASEARLRRFAADASHELRTPLAAIRGYAELARRHPGPVPPDIGHALSRVESESARMSVLVDELLLLAQLDAGRPLAKEPVDLTRLTIDAAGDARAARPDHRWQLELPGEPVTVEGDEHRLRQVLANLLSNAGKHTPAGTTVTVTLASGQGRGTVELSVTDDGPGIPEELQPALFERFVRGDSARSGASGGSTGLGLAIVDAVAAAHGGSVSVTSQPGLTRFTIVLPQPGTPAAPSPGGHGSQAAPSAAGHGAARAGGLPGFGALGPGGTGRPGFAGQGGTGRGGVAAGPGGPQGFAGPQGGRPGGAAGGGLGGNTQVAFALSRLLSRGAAGYRWAAATVGAESAAPLQLASGAPIMAIGGFNGTDNTPALRQFERLVAAGEIHYFVGVNQSSFGGGSGPAAQITAWVKAHFTATTVGGETVYNLAHGTAS